MRAVSSKSGASADRHPAYDPAEGGYTGQVAVYPDELLYALKSADEGQW